MKGIHAPKHNYFNHKQPRIQRVILVISLINSKSIGFVQSKFYDHQAILNKLLSCNFFHSL